MELTVLGSSVFTCEYKALFGISRNDTRSPFMPAGTVHNVYYDYYSAIAASGEPGLVFWFLFVKMPLISRTPNCPRFTDEDTQALVDEYGSATVGPNYTVKDLWEARVKTGLVPLEEGVLKQWSHGRVLLTDSVHKVAKPCCILLALKKKSRDRADLYPRSP